MAHAFGHGLQVHGASSSRYRDDVNQASGPSHASSPISLDRDGLDSHNDSESPGCAVSLNHRSGNSHIGVATAPGKTETARTLWGAPSRAATRVKIRMAALVVPWAALPDMQKATTHKPTRSSFTLLRQLCNLIPPHLVASLARQHGAEAKSRTFKPTITMP